MLCSISGSVPEVAVVSAKSGLIFEKRLIEHEIVEHGVCPITKEPLTTEDLIEIKSDKTVKPRSGAANSIPGLLGIFHDEWDALMLESHSLRQSLTTTRQELSHALYQHDAACRVIARLLRERDAAKETLMKLQTSKRALPEEEALPEEHPIKKMHLGITQEMCDLIEATANASAERRGVFEISDVTASPEDLQNYSLATSQPLHATKQGGILAVKYHPTLTHLIASAGEDCTIKIFDQSSSRLVTSIEEHFKKVNGLSWIGEALLASCSADKSVRIWMRDSDSWEMTCGLNIKDHQEEVVALSATQNERFLISASKDATLGFIDLEQGRCLERLEAPIVDSAYTCAQLHPDSRLLAAGTEAGDLHLWDLAQQKIVKSFSEEESSGLVEISFHPDGHHFASATSDRVKLWDMRKMDSFKELQPYDAAVIGALNYDPDGRFLAVGGSDLRIYHTEHDYSPVLSFSDVPGNIYSCAFGVHGSCVAAGSVDHNLRIFGPES